MATPGGTSPSARDIRRRKRAQRKEERRQARSDMALMDHFRELKSRLFKAALGIVLASIGGWFLFDMVFNSLQQPVIDSAEAAGQLISVNFTGVATALDMRIKVSLFVGLVISSPWWLYQLWAFITPGLARKEKIYAYGFVGATVPLFLGGGLLAWLVLPHAIGILTAFVPEDSANLLDAQTYLSFVMRLLLAFGLAFAMPVLLVGLNFMGLLSAATMLRGWRWAIVVAFTFSAMMTPTPDALTMILVALPICALYFVALGVAWLHDRKAAQTMERLDAELADY